MNEELIDRFHKEMLGIYNSALNLTPPYRATRFYQMVLQHGGYETAKRLLTTGNPSEGFTQLYLRGPENLRLSVEYLVLQQPWSILFEEQHLAKAKKRLVDMGVSIPKDDVQ
ncbi:hypothetical protein B4900_11380 [Yersinia rohdei]|uniref:Uncharacterized protein n=1 Tax=Yersinia rohdei TaxID=29485 RepID=A0A0U1HX22_YERRO|nr:hypothetical protein [Yersinia rohdei]OWF79018.1 hypothetical protein B4900_11380 [Yersinia rohdei]CQI96092.1 Uncharacterised protein [Yersinia rohdei]